MGVSRGWKEDFFTDALALDTTSPAARFWKNQRRLQITIRDTKDCFYLYEVPPSRVTKQVIGLCIPRTWLEHLDDENWRVVDTDEIGKISIKTCTSV